MTSKRRVLTGQEEQRGVMLYLIMSLETRKHVV